MWETCWRQTQEEAYLTSLFLGPELSLFEEDIAGHQRRRAWDPEKMRRRSCGPWDPTW